MREISLFRIHNSVYHFWEFAVGPGFRHARGRDIVASQQQSRVRSRKQVDIGPGERQQLAATAAATGCDHDKRIEPCLTNRIKRLPSIAGSRTAGFRLARFGNLTRWSAMG